MTRQSDVVARVIKFNRRRDPERLALKWKAMQKDALGFFRGTCHLYCEDWPTASPLNETPSVWVCGDLHIENFGAYKGDNRLVYFDIADFDESILAPCAWDLTRLATSALVAAKVHGLKRKSAVALCRRFLEAYTVALRDGKPRWVERAIAQGPIKSLLEGLEGRKRAAFLAGRSQLRDGKLGLRIDEKHTLAAHPNDRKRIKKFVREFGGEESNPRFFNFIDVARRIAGTGSLGLERFTILVEGRGRPAGYFLLDLKYAAASALARYVTVKQPRWKNDAERIVAVERRMQAISPALLHAVSIDSKFYVLRELMPTQDKLDLKKWKGAVDDLDILARDLGFLVAWAELRSSGRGGSAIIDELIEFAAKTKWQRSVIDYAEHYQEIACRDWKVFRNAYRDGAFKNTTSA